MSEHRNNLALCRKQKRLSQEDVAKYMSISQSQYSNWENGKSRIDDQSLNRLAEFYEVSTDFLLNRANTDFKKVFRVPVLGNVAAGIPIDAIEDIVDWEELPESIAKSGEYFGLRIKGASMEPRIMEGDTVIVRRQPDVESGEIAIVLVNGDEGTCKRLVKHANGGISLIAINSAVYEPHFYTPDEILSLPITIVGKVIELRGKF